MKIDKQKSSLALVPQRFDGQFRISEFITRAEGDPADKLPPGCCAKMIGTALVYNTTDDYGTMFAPGCLAQTIAERVRPGKVRLFADHKPETKTHVGTVIDIRDVGDTAQMTAVIFDTVRGREMKEYLEAVTQSGAVTGAMTGLSVGFRSREDESITIEDEDGETQWACLFKVIELREISITPVNAVPGSDVLSVRREHGEPDQGLLQRMLARILSEVPEREARVVFETTYASGADQPDTGATPTGATPASASAPDAVAESESAPAAAVVVEAAPVEAVAASLEERRRILREVVGVSASAAP